MRAESPPYRVLLALADEERHGYAILQEIARQSGGGPSPAPAPSTPRSSGWWMNGLLEPPKEDGRRRYYRLTPHGRTALADETARMAELIAIAKRKLLLPERGLSSRRAAQLDPVEALRHE